MPSALPDAALYSRDQDAYWAELRKQFLVPPDEIYLNNGTVGSSPAPVLRHLRRLRPNRKDGPAGS
jgi:hypothetical protein